MSGKLILIFIVFLTSCIVRPTPSDVVYSFNDGKPRTISNDLTRGIAPLNYASIKKYILKPKCITCHSGATAKPLGNGAVDFSTYELAMQSADGIPLVIKGNSNRGRLIGSLTHQDPEKRMPLKANELTQLEMNFITNWIEACAPKETLDEIPEVCPSDDDDDWVDDDDWDEEDF